MADIEPAPEMTIFTMPDCPHCARAKEWLSEHGCPFEERDITADVEALREWRALSGGKGVPVIAYGRDIVIGFNAHRLDGFVDSCRNTTPVEDEATAGGGPAGGGDEEGAGP